MKFVFVPYDPSAARIVEHSRADAAVRWFRAYAATCTSKRAHLNTDEGRCLASFADGEFTDHRKKG